MSERPPRDLDWVPDDSTGITVPSQTKQNAGWIVEKPARQFFNFLANRQSRWTHYFSGQSQEWIVIDSANANDKDYDTLAAYIADSPAAGDKVLVKEDQTITAQLIIPPGITLKFLDGTAFLSSENIATSIVKLGTNIIIEGVLDINLTHTGTTAKAVELDGENTIGNINVRNQSTGILTTAYHINVNKTRNRINGFVRNLGGGTLTNVVVDNSAGDTNLLEIGDEPNSAIVRGRGKNTMFSGFKFKFGSDADGDIYYRDAGILKRLAKGSNDTWLKLTGGIPAWSNVGKFLGGLSFNLGSDADGDIYYRDAGILKRLPKATNEDFLSLKAGIPSWQTFPSFSVHRNSVVQNNITGTDKIEWTTKEFDTNSDFDSTTNYRFTPTIAGKYLLSVGVYWLLTVSGDDIVIKLYKNGVEYKNAVTVAGGITETQTITAVVDANGTTDYFEVFALNLGRDTSDINGFPETSYFTGCRIA